ncbi:hypothetical protein S96127_4310 (plasmid) [Yersinia pestis]|nr:hypothetical protein S96127_4310 [Yersinia pestis]
MNKSYLEPAQKLVYDLSSRKTPPQKQIAHFSDMLEKAKKEGNTEQVQKLQGSIRGYQEHLEAVAQELTQAEFERDSAAKTGKGVMSTRAPFWGWGRPIRRLRSTGAVYAEPDGTPRPTSAHCQTVRRCWTSKASRLIGPKQLKNPAEPAESLQRQLSGENERRGTCCPRSPH